MRKKLKKRFYNMVQPKHRHYNDHNFFYRRFKDKSSFIDMRYFYTHVMDMAEMSGASTSYAVGPRFIHSFIRRSRVRNVLMQSKITTAVSWNQQYNRIMIDDLKSSMYNLRVLQHEKKTQKTLS